MKSLILLGLVCVLGGCAQPLIDSSNLPSAMATFHLASDQCGGRLNAKEFKSAHDATSCYVEAWHDLVMALKVKDTSLFNAFQARALLASDELDAGHITAPQFFARYTQETNDLAQQLAQTASLETDRRHRNAAFFAALAQAGRAMQQTATAMQPIPPSSFNCTSTQTGIFTNTQCN